MFASLRDAIANRLDFQTRERRDFLARLVPVEKLVRILMVVEAATYLLMTPEGRRLRAETPKITPPAPPQPVGARKTPPTIRILLPGWQTIAAYHPRIDPRVVEREQREALERRLADYDKLTQDTPDDLSGLNCRFSILRWSHPERDPTPVQPAKRRSTVGLYSDTTFPIVRGMTIVSDQRASPRDVQPDSPNLDLARRVEALSRVLANPAPAIHRLAKRLAALPADCLGAPDMGEVRTRHWRQGTLECWSASYLADDAIRSLIRAQELPPPEPG
jgi:hypothetical protein